jgi:hypothetical protein
MNEKHKETLKKINEKENKDITTITWRWGKTQNFIFTQ